MNFPLSWIFIAAFVVHSPFAFGYEIDQQKLLNRLFKVKAVDQTKAAAHTFVFQIQGASDHFVPRTYGKFRGEYAHADAVDVERIKVFGKNCPSCNIVLLHSQRRTRNFFDRSTSLRVYSNNKKLLSKHIKALRLADPAVLGGLLEFSGKLFPNSHLHFIYRGHNFLGPEPFDFNFIESSYGPDPFVDGLTLARLEKTLASITFAACKMKSEPFISRLGEFAQTIIASEQILNQCPDSHGFNYDFILDVRNQDSPDQVSERIRSRIFSRAERKLRSRN